MYRPIAMSTIVISIGSRAVSIPKATTKRDRMLGNEPNTRCAAQLNMMSKEKTTTFVIGPTTTTANSSRVKRSELWYLRNTVYAKNSNLKQTNIVRQGSKISMTRQEMKSLYILGVIWSQCMSFHYQHWVITAVPCWKTTTKFPPKWSFKRSVFQQGYAGQEQLTNSHFLFEMWWFGR